MLLCLGLELVIKTPLSQPLLAESELVGVEGFFSPLHSGLCFQTAKGKRRHPSETAQASICSSTGFRGG